MNQLKNWAIALLGVLALSVDGFGCGGTAAEDEGLWLGDNGEAIQSKISAGYTYGVGTLPSHLACKGVTGESCVMPAKRAFKVCFDATMDSHVKASFQSAFAAVQAATSNRFTFTNQGNCPPGGGPLSSTDVIANSGGGVCWVGGVNDIELYGCQNFTLTSSNSQLSDPFPGDYFVQSASGNTAPANPGHVASVMSIDYPRILAKGATAAEDTALLDHATHYVVWGLVGIGGHTETTTSMTSRAVLPIPVGRTEGTAGDRCRASSYTVNDLTSYSVIGSCPTD